MSKIRGIKYRRLIETDKIFNKLLIKSNSRKIKDSNLMNKLIKML